MGMFDFLGTSSNKQTSEPWKAQQPFIKKGFEQAGTWLENVNDTPSPDISRGRDMQRQSALSGFGGATENQNYVSNLFSSGELLSPESNPWLSQNLDRLGAGITEQAGRNNNIINQQAAQAGAYGGGRQGVAQGLNAETANEAYADASSRMLMDNYSQMLRQMQAQQQFLPQQAQLDQMPGMVLENLGLAEDNQAMDNLARYWSIIGANNWGGTTTGRQTASPLQMFSQLGQGMGGMAKAGYI